MPLSTRDRLGGGTGVGLPIVEKLVERHGADLGDCYGPGRAQSLQLRINTLAARRDSRVAVIMAHVCRSFCIKKLPWGLIDEGWNKIQSRSVSRSMPRIWAASLRLM